MKRRFMAARGFILSLLLVGCATPVAKQSCESAEASYIPHSLPIEKKFSQFSKRCESDYQIQVDRAAYMKNYEKDRKKYFAELCNCESGFLLTAVHYDEQRGKTVSGSSILFLNAKASECKTVKMENEFLRGIDLARVKQKQADSKRKFSDRVWNGSAVLSKEDAQSACSGK